MKSLKLALLVTTAAGAVTAGGVTYASVSNNSAAPNVQAAKDPAVVKHAPAVKAPAVPAAPTCLPDAVHGKALDKLQELAKKAPNTPVSLPTTPGGLPQIPANVPDAAGKVPGVKDLNGKVAGAKGKVADVKNQAGNVTGKILPAADAAKLPLCNGGQQQQKGKQVNPPNVPTRPNLPVPANLSCDSVPPTIKNEAARAKDFTLPNGMTVGGVHAHRIVIQSRAACEYTQQFVGGAGQMVTVQRIQTPPQVTLQEMASSLKMAGSLVSVSGVDTWQSPLNGGMLWYGNNGYAIRIVGNNPTAAALVPPIATQLRTQ